ncbi:hypothetical protein PV326_002596 [Microctonus aethiopoides]|nr:hypothetical protein PV326_002596 [Microctonus aethiopoides]
MIPPDGGWGWIVVLACGLNNMVMVPLIQGMGLIFVQVFAESNIPATQKTIITSTNMSFGMAMGLIHGPLLRKFGYRKIALTGATLFATGILMTALSTKFSHFMICYGIMTSLGVGLSMASFSLSVNTYFREKRGRAMGMAMTLTGLGPIIMPQIISLLLNKYTSQGAILVLGAITLHTIVAASLLQPIKWHMKRAVNELSDNKEFKKEIVNDDDIRSGDFITNSFDKKQTMKLSDLNDDVKKKDFQALEIIEETKTNQVVLIRRNSVGKSLDSINLGSCPMLFDDSMIYGAIPIEPSDNNIKQKNSSKTSQQIPNENEKLITTNGIHTENKIKSSKSKGCCNTIHKIMHNIIEFFDLNLLSDPIYVNIMLGMAIATFSEMNFSILMAFMLDDINFTTKQIAASMSTMAAVDLIMRGFSPFIGEWLRQTPRILYLVSLAMLIISRTILIFCTGFIPVIIMAIGIGFAKGFRSVFTSLIVPSYIPLERLADATGIQTVVNGIILMALGPLMGIIRESRGSYGPCIVILNAMSALTIVMWVTEMIIVKRIAKRKFVNEQYAAVAIKE